MNETVGEGRMPEGPGPGRHTAAEGVAIGRKLIVAGMPVQRVGIEAEVRTKQEGEFD